MVESAKTFRDLLAGRKLHELSTSEVEEIIEKMKRVKTEKKAKKKKATKAKKKAKKANAKEDEFKKLIGEG